MNAFRAVCAALSMSLLAGCGAGDFSGAVSGNANEQARLKLVDQCMFDRSTSGDPLDRTRGPRCQCYARTISKQMSASEASAYVSTGAVPFSVKPPDVMASCRRG